MKVDTIKNTSESILRTMQSLCSEREPLLIAIDGRCAAGKTTLAAYISEKSECNVIHMDHFFLRPEQRTQKRLDEPGGNVDYERFLQEVLLPLKKGELFSYRPYDCQKQELTKAVSIEPKSICIIEGSYSCHPALAAYYDLKIFLHVEEKEQLGRISHRNGELGAAMFQNKWIPLEEDYFSKCHIPSECDLLFQIQ